MLGTSVVFFFLSIMFNILQINEICGYNFICTIFLSVAHCWNLLFQFTWYTVQKEDRKTVPSGRLWHKFYNLRRHFAKVGMISSSLLESEILEDEGIGMVTIASCWYLKDKKL